MHYMPFFQMTQSLHHRGLTIDLRVMAFDAAASSAIFYAMNATKGNAYKHYTGFISAVIEQRNEIADTIAHDPSYGGEKRVQIANDILDMLRQAHAANNIPMPPQLTQ